MSTIEYANSIINKYRESTHDVFLTAFMGNTKVGERRRRLDYRLARVIFNRANAMSKADDEESEPEPEPEVSHDDEDTDNIPWAKYLWWMLIIGALSIPIIRYFS